MMHKMGECAIMEARNCVRLKDAMNTFQALTNLSWRLALDIVSPDPSPGKMCEHCNVLQPLKQFHKNSSWCRTCFRVARKEAPPGKKMCTHCKEVKDLDAFKQDILWNKVRIASWCKPCAVEHARLRTLRTYDYQDHREAHLWHKYDGMTQAVYDAMLEVQGGVCAC